MLLQKKDDNHLDNIQGIRRDRTDDDIVPEPGEYGKRENGHWYCCPPDSPDLVGNLSKHDVTEHKDGTITVSPSILISHYSGKKWHGYLERGMWRKV